WIAGSSPAMTRRLGVGFTENRASRRSAAARIAAGGTQVAALLPDQRRRLAFRAARQMLHGAAAVGEIDDLAPCIGDQDAALRRRIGQEADGDHVALDHLA